MRLQKVFNCGKVINYHWYYKLQELDFKVFYGCGNEFLKNRDWWVVLDKDEIVAYCGCLYTQGICIFVRAWVHRNYRGKGLQSKMIKARIEAAKDKCTVVITYTTFDNVPSANNLIKNRFYLYQPAYAYAGNDKLYFKRAC